MNLNPSRNLSGPAGAKNCGESLDEDDMAHIASIKALNALELAPGNGFQEVVSTNSLTSRA